VVAKVRARYLKLPAVAHTKVTGPDLVTCFGPNCFLAKTVSVHVSNNHECPVSVIQKRYGLSPRPVVQIRLAMLIFCLLPMYADNHQFQGLQEVVELAKRGTIPLLHERR
jgi:hypothetical protein